MTLYALTVVLITTTIRSRRSNEN
jgi:hypothetical protein